MVGQQRIIGFGRAIEETLEVISIYDYRGGINHRI
jgi:hypothetical protein